MDLGKDSRNNSCFRSREEAIIYWEQKNNILVVKENLEFLINNHLLPRYKIASEEFFLLEDIDFVISIIRSLQAYNDKETPLYELFYDRNSFIIRDLLNNEFDFNTQDIKESKVFVPAIRNLISKSKTNSLTSDKIESFSTTYFSHSRITTSSKTICNLIYNQTEKIKLLEKENSSHFANSAYYMGSKKSLSSFLVEAISGILNREGMVVDLMCGSGAASGAFSNFWETISSDAQEFSCILAKIQGGGFSVSRAKELTDMIIKNARNHASDLMKDIKEFIDTEEDIFHSNTNNELLEKYKSFISSFPLYPDKINHSIWNPYYEVTRRKENKGTYPFCLFTCYFSNVYFGLRQCLEIDSLRFAIEELQNENEKEWALGVLIATISTLASNYGGHFAQPVKIEIGNLSKIIETRSQSIFHEFSIRFVNLAYESEKKSYPIKTIKGPYKNALLVLESILSDDREVMVYIDAPYKRDEYSRYYHLLETLIQYSYPSSQGSGRIPDKNKGERFKSEFFTRNQTNVNELFINLLLRIINNRWNCAWSYSDNGDANIKYVLESVFQKSGCRIFSYSIPYKHKSQGKRQDKKVTEYLIFFIPNK